WRAAAGWSSNSPPKRLRTSARPCKKPPADGRSRPAARAWRVPRRPCGELRRWWPGLGAERRRSCRPRGVRARAAASPPQCAGRDTAGPRRSARAVDSPSPAPPRGERKWISIVRVPVPTVPTRLPEISVVDQQRRGVPLVRLVRATDDDAAEFAEDGLWTAQQLPDEWTPGGQVTGKAGDVHALSNPARWLLGIGADPEKPSAWRTAGGALARAVNSSLSQRSESVSRAQRSVQVALPPEPSADCVRAFVLGVLLGGYRFTVSSEEPKPTLRSVVLLGGAELTETVREAERLAAATALARDLTNSPSNVKDPAWLAGTTERVADDVSGLRVTVRDEAWLAENKFGGILAVGGGSARPPRLIELAYRPRNAGTHVLLVGKGITFDTGGISLKPADGMHLMRTDMSGGAAVIAAVRAIAQAKLPVRVTGLVPAAENHVSGSSYRPGDVVRHYGGITTEVGNTDAEGRMVLADALAYGVDKFKP